MKQHAIRRLHQRRAVSLRLPAGSALLVARGMAWLTSDTQPGDRLLCPGKEYVTRGREHLVLQALGATVVYAIRSPAAAPSPARKRPAISLPWWPLPRPAFSAA